MTRVCKDSTIFTIQFICNNSYKNFIFHQKAMYVFFKCDIKLEGSIMSAPCMITLVAPEFKETFLNSFNYCEFIIIPFLFVLSFKESCKSFLRCPLYRNPFQSLWRPIIHYSCLTHVVNIFIWNNLNWYFPVNIIFNLFNWGIRSKCLNKI